jgi:large subunit ribosomal protein L23
MTNASDIIFGPIITEKTMKDAANGKYAFKVAVKANKNEIKKVVEDKFKVDVVSISTITIKGRTAKIGIKRIEVTKPSFKKAIVKVVKGQKIGMFDLNG